MKVIYEKSIEDKVVAAIQEAKSLCKEIEYIILTEQEAIELYDTCLEQDFALKGGKQKCGEVGNHWFYGVPLKVEGYDD